jgi:accessory colonization factor AcfC
MNIRQQNLSLLFLRNSIGIIAKASNPSNNIMSFSYACCEITSSAYFVYAFEDIRLKGGGRML